jgi:hypothetical protein
MTRALRRITLLLTLGHAALAAPLHAQSKTGTAIGDFLLIEPSARIAAMGNAGVSIDDGLQAAYYNPAMTGRLGEKEIVFSHAQWIDGIAYDHVAFGLPLGKIGNTSLAVTSLRSGDIAVRTVDAPLGTGEQYTVSDIAIGLGYGLQVTDRVAAGLTVTFMQETIYHSSASTWTLSAGTLYRLAPNGLSIGASLSNFGTSARFEGRDLSITYDQDPSRVGDNNQLPGDKATSDWPLPLVFRVGVGMPFQIANDQKLMVVADALHPSDETESMSLGAEWTWRRLLAVRGGYQQLFQTDAEAGLTGGAGIRSRIDTFVYRLDYAWADQGRLGSTHRLSLGLTF